MCPLTVKTRNIRPRMHLRLATWCKAGSQKNPRGCWGRGWASATQLLHVRFGLWSARVPKCTTDYDGFLLSAFIHGEPSSTVCFLQSTRPHPNQSNTRNSQEIQQCGTYRNKRQTARHGKGTACREAVLNEDHEYLVYCIPYASLVD